VDDAGTVLYAPTGSGTWAVLQSVMASGRPREDLQVTQAVDPDILGGGGAQAFVNDLVWALTLISILAAIVAPSPRRVLVRTGVGGIGDTRCGRWRDSGLISPGCLR
jgi:hypothetical protein